MPKKLRLSTVAGALGVAALLSAPWAGVANAGVSSLLESSINVPNGPGSIEGFGQGYDVSPSSGLPGLSYAISVPPGRAGLEPSVSLSYAGGKGAGLLGLGWSFEQPCIELSTRRGFVRYDGTETLSLRGLGSSEELVNVNGEYRESIEGSTPIIVRTSGAGYAATTTSGTTYLFGVSPEGRYDGPDGTYRWELEAIVDTSGNRVEFAYTQLEGTSRPLLNAASYNDGAARVYFDYEERPDPVVSRAPGFEDRLEHRLSGVRTEADGEPVLTTSLIYASSAEVPSSQLTSIATVAADGTALPTWRMSYAAMLGQQGPVELEGGPQIDPTAAGRAWVDVDGDSSPDLLDGQPGQWRYRRNLGGQELADWVTLDPSPSVEVDAGSRFADMNGDGVQDLLFQITPGDVDYFVFLGGGETPFGTSEEVTIEASVDIEDPRISLVDLNLDSRTDILFDEGVDAFMWMRDFDDPFYEDGEEVPPLPSNMGLSEPGVSFTDINGDRLFDLVRVMPADNRVLVATGEGDGLFGEPWEMDGVPSMSSNDRWELRDINGDNAADLVRVGEGQLSLWINQLDGSFEMVSDLSWDDLQPSEKVIFTDVNSNGTVDVLRADTAGGNGWRYWDLLGQQPGLLSRFENGLGYTIDFEYSSAGQMAAEASGEGDGWESFAPQAMPVVARTIERDGLDWERVVEVDFRDGWYDPRKQEFRGFAEVAEFRAADDHAEETRSVTRYDLGQQDEARKLKPIENRVEAPDGVISRDVTTLEVFEQAPGVTVCRATASDSYSIERGDEADAVRMRTETDYDEWGNVLESREYGVVELESGDDVPGDERVTQSTYADPSAPLGPRDRLAESRVLDEVGNPVSAVRTYYDGEPEQGLALGNVGDRGLPTREETWLAADRWVVSARRAYDVYGNVIRVVDAEGGMMESRYDDVGLFAIEESISLDDTTPIDALTTSAVWDSAFGVPTEVVSPTGSTTRVAYDGLGRPTAIARPGDTLDLPTLTYEYFLDGETDYPAVRSVLRRFHGNEEDVEEGIDQLDGLGRLRRRVVENDAGDGAVLSEARFYDVEGNVAIYVEGQDVPRNWMSPGLIEPLQPDWPTSETWTDAANRVIRARSVTNRETQTSFAPLRTIVRTNDDLAGEAPYADTPQVSVADGLGRTVELRDELTDRDVMHGYEYDAADRLVSHTDPAGNVSFYVYEGDGRLIEVDSPDAGITTQTFDDVGRVLSRIDARGAQVDYFYDVIGRALSERSFDANGDLENEVTYSYDVLAEDADENYQSWAIGQLTHVEDHAGAYSFVYDGRGRVERTSRRFDKAGGGSFTMSTGARYDAQDRLITEIFPDNTKLDRRYSQRGLEEQVGEFASLTYNALGQMTHCDLGTDVVGLTEDLVFDRDGRMLEQVIGSGGTTQYDVSHSYDAAGFLRETVDRLGATSNTPTLSQSFVYDDLHRLVAASADYGSLSWRYTDDGNLLENDGKAIEYTGPAPHAATKLGSQSLSYDVAGQLTQISGTAEGPTALQPGSWTFDAYGRVTEVAHEDGRRQVNVYDSDGQRAIKREYGKDGSLDNEIFYFGNAELRGGKLVRWVFAGGRRVAESRKKDEAPSGGYGKTPLAGLAWLVLIGFELLRRMAMGLKKGGGTWPKLATVATSVVALFVLVSCATGGGNGKLETLTPDKRTRWHVQDRLTSAALVFDGEGEVVARSANRPYGEKWVDWKKGGVGGATYRFTDKEDDAVSGGVYIGARHYLPGLGRWASPDPKFYREDVSAVLEQSREANVFQYAAGRPSMLVDPDGKDAKSKALEAKIGLGKVSLTLKIGVALDDKGNVAVFVAGSSGADPAGGALKKIKDAGLEAGVSSSLHKNENGVDDLAGPSLDVGAGAKNLGLGVGVSEGNTEASVSLGSGGGASGDLGISNTKVKKVVRENTLVKWAYYGVGTSNPITGITKRAIAEAAHAVKKAGGRDSGSKSAEDSESGGLAEALLSHVEAAKNSE